MGSRRSGYVGIVGGNDEGTERGVGNGERRSLWRQWTQYCRREVGDIRHADVQGEAASTGVGGVSGDPPVHGGLRSAGSTRGAGVMKELSGTTKAQVEKAARSRGGISRHPVDVAILELAAALDEAKRELEADKTLLDERWGPSRLEAARAPGKV